MAVKGSGASAQSMTVLQRTARLYEGECWWLFDGRDQIRGLLLFDGGDDLARLQVDICSPGNAAYRFCRAQANSGSAGGGETCAARTTPPAGSFRPDCQVTVEERTQLFGLLKKGSAQSVHGKG